ncbi:hypothetical protein [Variovorax sp. RA8]|uniref:hypothetical protein n=1 Tax=Variovorax sp. (strain JCM 16519 / RA8) TaxID=662548 RepID=UPI000B251C51|nr:hypothetical protein [Variovorax sp. RA8]VTU16388.1 hypothetical protein RA8CHR_01256 [Variovorax sp. RA8]
MADPLNKLTRMWMPARSGRLPLIPGGIQVALAIEVAPGYRNIADNHFATNIARPAT